MGSGLPPPFGGVHPAHDKLALASGLMCTTIIRAINTRFRYASILYWDLGSRIHKLVGSFFNRHAVEVLLPRRLLVNIWFQVYFIALPGCFSPFPHGTSSLSISKSI